METIAPFRAWRYAPKAGDLNLLVAPPYDVIDPGLQSRLYAASPHNVVRVDLGMTMPSDNDCDNRYTRAEAQIARWKETGVLLRDPAPTVTFVEEGFTGPDGRARVRHGCLAAMRLYEYGEGVVFPHEHTLTGPKEDRFRLMAATGMSLSPVFFLYDLPDDGITAAWRSEIAAREPAATVRDQAGTVTRLWPTSDPTLLETVQESLAASRFIIADGHHRYETALRYREHRRAAPRAVPLPRPACDYCLAYFSNMADPALAIFGTHRLLTGLPSEVVATLPHLLEGDFAVDQLPGGSAPEDGAGARAAISTYLDEHPRGAFGLWGPELGSAYGLRLLDPASARAAAPGHSDPYQRLDVTILQTLVFEKALGLTAADMAAERYVTFFKDTGDAFARLAAGEFQAGFFMNPTGLDQVRDVALGGERMPQKATFFYPKLPTGLVFHELDSVL